MDHTPITHFRLRQRFLDYVTGIFPDLGRKDRYPRAEVYMRGLLPEGESKSIEPLASGLPDGYVPGGIPR